MARNPGKVRPYMKGLKSNVSCDSQTECETMAVSNQQEQISTSRRVGIHWQMFLVILIPVATMLSLCSVNLSQASNTLEKTSSAMETIDDGHLLTTLVKHLQRERGLSTSFLNAHNLSFTLFQQIEDMRHETNKSVMRVRWPSDGLEVQNKTLGMYGFLETLSKIRDEVDQKSVSVIDNLQSFTELTQSIIKHVRRSVTPPDNIDIHRMLVANEALLSMTDNTGVERALGSTFFINCGWPSKTAEDYFLAIKGQSYCNLATATYYHANIESKYTRKKQTSLDLVYFIDNLESNQLFRSISSDCSTFSSTELLLTHQQWFANMTTYIDMLFEILLETDTDINNALHVLQKEVRLYYNLFLSIQIISTIVSFVLCSCYFYGIASLMRRLSKYAKNLEIRNGELAKEKIRTNHLLYQMIPKKIANKLKLGEPPTAEHFEQVTIYFSNIVDFSKIAARSEPIEIVNMLNDIYSLFDECIDSYDVYKVESVGDAYMVASGVPVPNGLHHAQEIALMALKIRCEINNYKIPHMPGEVLQIRIGIHSGPCVAGVVGIKMPRYCLFGHTVNTASKMESTGLGGRIHLSSDTNSILIDIGSFTTEFRGMIEIKGKGTIPTYWLNRVEE